MVARCLRVSGDEDSVMSYERFIHIQEIQLVKQQDWYLMFVYLVSESQRKDEVQEKDKPT